MCAFYMQMCNTWQLHKILSPQAVLPNPKGLCWQSLQISQISQSFINGRKNQANAYMHDDVHHFSFENLHSWTFQPVTVSLTNHESLTLHGWSWLLTFGAVYLPINSPATSPIFTAIEVVLYIMLMSTKSVIGTSTDPMAIKVQSNFGLSEINFRCSMAGKMIAKGMLQKLPSMEMNRDKYSDIWYANAPINSVSEVRNKFFNHLRVNVGGPLEKSLDSRTAKVGKMAKGYPQKIARM